MSPIGLIITPRAVSRSPLTAAVGAITEGPSRVTAGVTGMAGGPGLMGVPR